MRKLRTLLSILCPVLMLSCYCAAQANAQVNSKKKSDLGSAKCKLINSSDCKEANSKDNFKYKKAIVSTGVFGELNKLPSYKFSSNDSKIELGRSFNHGARAPPQS